MQSTQEPISDTKKVDEKIEPEAVIEEEKVESPRYRCT
jgi:hypothetical protein